MGILRSGHRSTVIQTFLVALIRIASLHYHSPFTNKCFGYAKFEGILLNSIHTLFDSIFNFCFFFLTQLSKSKKNGLISHRDQLDDCCFSNSYRGISVVTATVVVVARPHSTVYTVLRLNIVQKNMSQQTVRFYLCMGDAKFVFNYCFNEFGYSWTMGGNIRKK